MSIQALSEDRIRARLRGALAGWSWEQGALGRTYRTGAWPRTLLLANAIGYAAEAAGHHPDLVLGYARLSVRLTTHDAGGVTERDLEMAERIEALVTARPGEGSALEGPPRDWIR